MSLKPGKRLLIAFACVLLVLATGLAVAWARADPLRSSARRAWKDGAVAAIERRVADAAWLDAERARLRRGGWVGDDLLVMANGDWIACRSVCRKEPGRVYDLFIGRGSNGRWYYSTFHFCVGKVVLQVEPRPASLASFVDGYFLVPFDGRSDDALRETWHNDLTYGEGRSRTASTQP